MNCGPQYLLLHVLYKDSLSRSHQVPEPFVKFSQCLKALHCQNNASKVAYLYNGVLKAHKIVELLVKLLLCPRSVFLVILVLFHT